ncbi:anthrone oxygenase family protein [Micromonospora lutea]|uniref:Membrane protein n=1 Tax=Micromonospora lutea TaxID=419825 RepID=A0ABQ4IWT9_9ACTN|nr:anthrone oxygenase family protein [Micromonospora lutea]GIJ22384.1 membrane protein [Micromonospora lutea]
MSEPIRLAVLSGATLATGLVAGLFFAYACSVMPGLAATDGRTLVGTMQSINRKIINGWFLSAFLGGPLLVVAAVVGHLGTGGAVRGWLVAALVSHVITLGVTGRFSVPLNNRLEAAGPVDGIGDLAGVRKWFETPWVRWNLVRTVSSVAAFVCLIGALLAR